MDYKTRMSPLFLLSVINKVWTPADQLRVREEKEAGIPYVTPDLEKIVVSYITGKTRIIQRWFRSFEELPPCCPCPE